MGTIVVLRHPVTTLVTAINNPNKLTNGLLILKLFDIRLLWDRIENQLFFCHALTLLAKMFWHQEVLKL